MPPNNADQPRSSHSAGGKDSSLTSIEDGLHERKGERQGDAEQGIPRTQLDVRSV